MAAAIPAYSESAACLKADRCFLALRVALPSTRRRRRGTRTLQRRKPKCARALGGRRPGWLTLRLELEGGKQTQALRGTCARLDAQSLFTTAVGEARGWRSGNGAREFVVLSPSCLPP